MMDKRFDKKGVKFSKEQRIVFGDRVINPITRLDYPDPDVIRVGDIYYMVSTTMHFMPGGEILRSYDLVNWEHAAFVYDRLDSTPMQQLEGTQNIYGKGMWAASLRFYKNIFYVCFVANDTGKTYLYTSESIVGPWKKRYIEGFYHDCSLLFDEDNVYIAYGNKNIYITQLNAELTAPLMGGLHRLAVSDAGHPGLGYEGTHFYKINGKYYLFLIHSLRDRWMRTEACFVADSIDGVFTGGDVLVDDRGYCGQGVAQGGIVDTPDGKWYAMLFQDHGAVGRIPVLVPVRWEAGYPVFGENKQIPQQFEAPLSYESVDYEYEPLVQSDDFRKVSGLSEEKEYERYGCYGLKSVWQFNHEPDLRLVKQNTEQGILWIETGKVCQSLLYATNILTQRMIFPCCAGEVTVEASTLKIGDYAGLCALQGCYGMVAVTQREDGFYVIMKSKIAVNDTVQMTQEETIEETEWEVVRIRQNTVRLRIEVNFAQMKDEAKFFYYDEEYDYDSKSGSGVWKQIGIVQKLHFGLDHFVGCRFGLFVYATKETGGKAGFVGFRYDMTSNC
jgi:beta-xylosidase